MLAFNTIMIHTVVIVILEAATTSEKNLKKRLQNSNNREYNLMDLWCSESRRLPHQDSEPRL